MAPMPKRDSGLEYTLCRPAVKYSDAFIPLFQHSLAPRPCGEFSHGF